MRKMDKRKTDKILRLLEAEYPDAGCELEHLNVYELLVCVTLSAQTTDASVNRVSPALFAAYPDAHAMAQADPEDVAEIIKRIGMYKTKSKRIIDQAKMLVEKYDGNVPEDDEMLVQLPGVGRKTANVVMAEGFGHQRIAVDTHVFRVSNRIGLAEADNVEKTEEDLRNANAARSQIFVHITNNDHLLLSLIIVVRHFYPIQVLVFFEKNHGNCFHCPWQFHCRDSLIFL